MHYGIQPWQVADLTFGEIEAYIAHLNEMQQQATGTTDARR